MKRNIVNDKVIRAMAIGISAMLATTTPMTALAADGVDDPEGDNPNEAGQTTTPVSDVCDAAQEAADAAQKAAVAAQGSAETVITDVKENVVPGEAGVDSEGKDLAKKVIGAAEDTKKDTSLKDAETAIENTDTQLDTAETNDGLSDSALGKATDAATNAGTIEEELNNAMDEANAKVDEQLDDIQNATTIADANAAYAELETTASAAQQDFETKLDAYNAAKAAYDEAAAKVKEYEDAYKAAVESAGSNVDAAQAALKSAQANAAALEQAVADAKAAVGKSAKEAMVIAELEYLTEHDDGLNWRNEDKLFIAIMENYYLPEKLDIQGATVTRVQGKDNNEYNYFKAVYKDADGNEQVKYYNFKMDKDENGKDSKDNIVIFEKREVETKDISDVLLHEYDVCVDQNGNKVDVDEAIKDGTISKYVEKCDMIRSETLVPNSEITETSTTDVNVDEKTKKESWSYDVKTGELVKTITADVTTTITFTGASFDGAFEEAENTNAEYTATGTYIPTFTREVKIKNEEVERKYNPYILLDEGVMTESEAYDVVFDRADEEFRKELKDELNLNKDEELYLIDSSKMLEVSGFTKGNIWDDSDFLISGTVTATYAKVTKQTVDQSTFGSLWDDIKALFGSGPSTNEKLSAAAKEAVEADGGIFLSANWDDLRYNKATIRYVAGVKFEDVKVKTDEQATKDDVKNAVKKAALADAQDEDEMVTGVYNVKVTGITEKANKPVATETYGNASGLSGQIIQNKNYHDDYILLDQKDKDYRQFVDVASKYVRLLNEAKQANADVLAAQNMVKDLQDKIKALEGKSTNTNKLDELKAKLDVALEKRNAAEETLNDILKKLENAGVTRDEVVDKLTPKTPDGNGGNGGNPGGNGGNGENGDNAGNDDIGGAAPGTTYGGPGTDTTTAGPATVVTTTTTAAATANTAVAAQTVAANGAGVGNVAAGNAGAGNAAGNAAARNQGVVTIEDEATPLAASIDDQDTTDTEQNKEDAQSVTIEDEASPLDASIDQEKMSWWWLLIVLVLGATGYEMYRKHQEKKKAAEEIKVEE